MIWRKWLPWRWILKHVAKAEGFIDPVAILAKLQRFAQPSEVLAPVELLRMGLVLQARGLINSQAIQHNLDWVWPYWVERQFDPHSASFIPRAFSMTHINLTHRNWTAVGIPGCKEMPIVDPRGLVTPHFDRWSLDCWIITKNGGQLFPSKLETVSQELICNGKLEVRTRAEVTAGVLEQTADVCRVNENPVCRLRVTGYSEEEAWLAIALRPFNPEGVSFIEKIETLQEGSGWLVNGKEDVWFDQAADARAFSDYRQGDVALKIPKNTDADSVKCSVGMATAAALFKLAPSREKKVEVRIPLRPGTKHKGLFHSKPLAGDGWKVTEKEIARLSIPDKKFQYLYDAALHSLILHSPGQEVFPGPYTYKHFWFRDAVMILHAMISAGLKERAESIIDTFHKRQGPMGYFHSQAGEWDSNGQVLWLIRRFCELTVRPPKLEWKHMIRKAARWISHKRLRSDSGTPHAGLFPAGFSAEHLGPNDYYYWDDFWGVAGLKSAGSLLRQYGEEAKARECENEAADFLSSIEKSLDRVPMNPNYPKAMPSSPYRRLDSSSIGSIAAGYPLQLWSSGSERIRQTVSYLLDQCFIEGGLFHDMSHSGINPYLTLQIAQCLLRQQDNRFAEIMKTVAALASPTEQWPEAIHPVTKGGCMGDGQHIWASAEWIMMIRNCFVREEGDKLVLCSGIPDDWLHQEEKIFFGPANTAFGPVTIHILKKNGKPVIQWDGRWYEREPEIEIRIGNHDAVTAKKGIREIPVEEKVGR